MVLEPTHRVGDTENILDLFFTTNEKLIENVQVIPGIGDHEGVMVDVILKLVTASQK